MSQPLSIQPTTSSTAGTSILEVASEATTTDDSFVVDSVEAPKTVAADEVDDMTSLPLVSQTSTTPEGQGISPNISRNSGMDGHFSEAESGTDAEITKIAPHQSDSQPSFSSSSSSSISGMLVSTAPGTNSVNQNGLSSPLPFEEINHPTVNHSNTSVHQGLEGPNLNRVSGDDTPTQAAIEAVELPWYLGHDYSNSDISFNRKGFVEGGTLGALVERLTLHDSFDGGFVATFMLTYRSFTTTSQLFTHLFQRFTISPPQELDREQLAQWTDRKQTPIRHRVFNIIKSWLENCFLEHEEEDHQVLSMIKEFSKSSPMRESLGFAAVQLIKLVEKREASGGMSGKTVLNLSTLAPPLPIVPRNLKRIQFMDIDPLEFARQLTIMEANCYNQIKPVDCLSKAWISTDPSIGLNIKNMIKASDLYSNWINEIVLSEKKISKRAAVIKHLIAVAVKLRQLNNFSMLVATISALARGPVHRLKRTWKQVPSRFMTALATLQDVTSPSMGWSEYRQQLQSVNLPCIPYLGLLLTDLVYVEDGYSKHLRRAAQHINFHKCVRTAEVIREIQQYQSVPYSLTSIHEIQAYIRQGMDQSKSATELYGQSLELEPREEGDEKIRQLLADSRIL